MADEEQVVATEKAPEASETASAADSPSPTADPEVLEKAKAYDQIVYRLSVDPYNTLKEAAERAGYRLLRPEDGRTSEDGKSQSLSESDFDLDDPLQSSQLDSEKVMELAKRAVEEVEREKMTTLQRAKKIAEEAKPFIKQQQKNFSAFERIYDKFVQELDVESAKQLLTTGGITALVKEAELQAYREGLLGRGGVPLSPVSGAPGAGETDEEEQLRVALGWSREKWREVKKREKELFSL